MLDQNKKIAVIVFLFFTSFVLYYLFVQNKDTLQSVPTLPELVSLPTRENNSKDPFESLTIPYLSSRKYQSTLGERSVVVANSNYTSYTTSYDSDSLKVNGLLTIPTGDTPAGGWPAIVFVHGYIPPSVYKTQSNYVSYVDYLARNGFVVFKIDLRGHADSEGEPSGAYYSGDYVIDTLNARAALAGSDFVNGNKVGLWGHSMAGNVVFRAMASAPIPAAVIWAGAVYTYEDMAKYGINDNSYRPPSETRERQRRREELRALHGDFDPKDVFWKQVPATNYLDKIKGALQLHHAVNDSVVNIGYSRELVGILDKTNIPHALYEYPTGGHNIEGASFTKAMQTTVEFYNDKLK